MRKNKLIELLQDIPGNPEVVFWNGFVGDYQHIHSEITKLELVRVKKSHLKKLLVFERMRASNYNLQESEIEITDEELDSAYANHGWETQNAFFSDEEAKEYYGKKRSLYCLEIKERGIETWDRIGNISY